jgi:hypothetical protein
VDAEVVMPRKQKRTVRRPTAVPLASADAAAAMPAVPILNASAGGSLTVDVDVTSPSADYTVQFADKTVIFARVDRRETVTPLVAGRFFLGWHFVHFAKGWAHQLSVSADGKPFAVLSSRSEANKDDPREVGFALVVVS